MGGLHSRDDATELPRLRREVIIPRATDALAFHRRIAVLSILVAMLAGSLDAMLWREAQLQTEHTQIEARIAAERAEMALEADAMARQIRVEMPVQLSETHADSALGLGSVQ